MPLREQNGKTVWGWALYDFANSAFTTLVVTFIWSTYFTKGIVGDENRGTAIWSLGVTVTAIVVALASPYVGTIADKGGLRKRFLLWTTSITILFTLLLYFPKRGDILPAMICVLVANIAYEMANVFYNAYLPDIAPQNKIGKISGYGWAAGYLGGLLCLIVALVFLINPNPPWFGLSSDTDAPIRATNLLVAIWFTVFSIPMFLWVKEPKMKSKINVREIFRSTNRQLLNTFKEIRDDYRQIFNLLVARLVYNDGLVTIFAFGGIYAQGTFGFTTVEIIIFGIALNLAAGTGAFAFGFLDDKLGGKNTILISIVGLFVAGLIAAIAPNRFWFWIASIGVGILAGPMQSASRSLMGRFVPPNKENEFYGFFALSGKATAFMGPFLLGRFTGWFDSQRAGIATVLIFFVIGGLLLLRVDEKEGIALAKRE